MLRNVTKVFFQNINKKYFYFSIFYFIGFGLNLFVNRYVFHNLEEETYGKYSYYLSMLTVLAPIISFNIKDGVIRFYNDTSSSYWHSLTLLSFFSLFLAFIFSYFFSIYFLPFFFINFYNIAIGILRGREELFKFNLLRIIPPLVLLLLLSTLKPVHHHIVISLTGLGYFFATLFYGCLNFSKIKSKIFVEPDFPRIATKTRTLLKYSIPTVGTTLSLWAFNFFDQFIIEYYYDFAYLSDYAAAVKILNLFKVALSVVLVVYPVYYFKNYDKPEEIKNKRFLIIIAVIITTFIGLLFKDILYKLLNAEKYLETSFLLSYLLISEALRFTSLILLTIFSYLQKTIISTYIYLGITIISVLGNLIIVPLYGYIGSAIIALLSSLILFLISFLMMRKYEFNNE